MLAQLTQIYWNIAQLWKSFSCITIRLLKFFFLKCLSLRTIGLFFLTAHSIWPKTSAFNPAQKSIGTPKFYRARIKNIINISDRSKLLLGIILYAGDSILKGQICLQLKRHNGHMPLLNSKNKAYTPYK